MGCFQNPSVGALCDLSATIISPKAERSLDVGKVGSLCTWVSILGLVTPN